MMSSIGRGGEVAFKLKLDAPVNDFRLRWRKLKPLPKVKVYDSGPCINLPAEITDNKSGVTERAWKRLSRESESRTGTWLISPCRRFRKKNWTFP